MFGSLDDHSPDGPNVWTSFADIALFSALAILFVFFTYMLFSEEQIVQEEINRRKARITAAIQERFGERVIIYPDTTNEQQRIALGSHLLFATLSDTLKPEGAAIIDSLAWLLSEYRTEFHWLYVEGHADTMQITDNNRFRDNWELSSARATSVVRRIDPSTEIAGRALPPHPLRPDMFQATGRSFYHPVVEWNNLEENRRVEFVLVYDPKKVLKEMLAVNTQNNP
ncbi:OmpA family protein [bacterium]|nr:OmpA family protein [bacterium]